MDHFDLIYGSDYLEPLPAPTQKPAAQQLTQQIITSKPKNTNTTAATNATSNMQTEISNKRKKKILRKAAEQTWEDPSLEEWPENDFRIFCGDLGNEVNDDVLANAFKKYPSFVKARVVRDKKTLKSKGYGFVSIMNQDDYVRAMREMQGKYVGNRPVKLKRSEWQEKSAIPQKNKFFNKKKY